MYKYHFTLKTVDDVCVFDQDRTDPFFEDFIAERLDRNFDEIFTLSKGIASVERRDLETGETVKYDTPKELATVLSSTISELEYQKACLDESISYLNDFIEKLDKEQPILLPARGGKDDSDIEEKMCSASLCVYVLVLRRDDDEAMAVAGDDEARGKKNVVVKFTTKWAFFQTILKKCDRL